ncbi:hypothetical protein TNCV_2166871 [Trichonephila clavipes]|nr:hypothetical protein TNCV_2166871 [Trichonephila clavipes]
MEFCLGNTFRIFRLNPRNGGGFVVVENQHINPPEEPELLANADSDAPEKPVSVFYFNSLPKATHYEKKMQKSELKNSDSPGQPPGGCYRTLIRAIRFCSVGKVKKGVQDFLKNQLLSFNSEGIDFIQIDEACAGLTCSHPRMLRAHQAGFSRRSLAGVGFFESVRNRGDHFCLQILLLGFGSIGCGFCPPDAHRGISGLGTALRKRMLWSHLPAARAIKSWHVHLTQQPKSSYSTQQLKSHQTCLTQHLQLTATSHSLVITNIYRSFTYPPTH